MRSSSHPLPPSTLLATLAILVLGGAGPLDPPAGPVAPSYKTLAEVEPRTPINAANTPGDADSLFKITQPGSYYLTGNLTGVPTKHGIEIAAPNVTIDLRGFSLLGVPNSLIGITTDDAHPNITIRDGVVSGWGTHGIDLFRDGSGTGSLIENIHASDNTLIGIRANSHAVVRSCIAANNGNSGITAHLNSLLESCIAINSGSTGLSVGNGGAIRGCTAQGSAGTGINAGSGCSIADSAALSNSTGISTNDSCVITNCTARSNTGTGIRVSVSGSISGSAAIVNGGDGFFLEAASATDCRAHQNGGSGFRGTIASTVSHCAAMFNTQHGISLASDCAALHCTSRSNGSGGDGAGILLTGSDNRIESNNCPDNDWGVRATSSGNFIARNTCSGSSVLNWDIAAGNICLVVSATNAAAIAGNAGGTSPGSTNPSANYTY